MKTFLSFMTSKIVYFLFLAFFDVTEDGSGGLMVGGGRVVVMLALVVVAMLVDGVVLLEIFVLLEIVVLLVMVVLETESVVLPKGMVELMTEVEVELMEGIVVLTIGVNGAPGFVELVVLVGIVNTSTTPHAFSCTTG